MNLLGRLFGRPLPSAVEDGGAVSLYVHPQGTVIVPRARFHAKDGAFRSMQTMPPDTWQVLTADLGDTELGQAVRAGFDRIATFRAGRTYDVLETKNAALWRQHEPLRDALGLTKSARFWPVMSLVHVRSDHETIVISPNKTLRGGAFEGLVHNQDLSVPIADTDRQLGTAIRIAIAACR